MRSALSRPKGRAKGLRLGHGLRHNFCYAKTTRGTVEDEGLEVLDSPLLPDPSASLRTKGVTKGEGPRADRPWFLVSSTSLSSSPNVISSLSRDITMAAEIAIFLDKLEMTVALL